VPDIEFLFAVELTDQTRFDAMLDQLAAAVLGYAGCPGERVADMTAALRTELTAGAANGHSRCDVQFRAHAGKLLITVSCTGRPEWRTTLALSD
jgi:hypothetical protein